MADADTGSNPFLRRAYELRGVEDAAALYEDWAQTYDLDTVESMGYAGPTVAVARLLDLVDAGAEVLDAGCGTGLVGVELARHREQTLDGVDLSPAMLERARATGVYRDLAVADLTQPLAVDDDRYGAVICVGTLTEGHVGPAALADFVRVTRPGGVVVATVLGAIWESQGYRAAVDDLAAQGRATLLEADEHPYRTQQGVTCRLAVLTVTAHDVAH